MNYDQLTDLIEEFVRVQSALVLKEMGPNTAMTISDDEYQMYAERASLRGVIRDLVHAVTWRNPEIALEGVIDRMNGLIHERGEQIANSLPDEVTA